MGWVRIPSSQKILCRLKHRASKYKMTYGFDPGYDQHYNFRRRKVTYLKGNNNCHIEFVLGFELGIIKFGKWLRK